MTDKEELLRMLDLSPDNTGDDELLEEFDFGDEGETDLEELSPTVLEQDDWDQAKGENLWLRHFGPSSNIQPEAVADFHSLAFHLDPQIAGKCISKRRQQFVETMMESPEYKQLHQSTRQNLLASEMATIRIGKQFNELVEKDRANRISTKDLPPGDASLDGNCLVAVATALKQAQEEADAVEESQKALGQAEGLGQGDAGSAADMEKIRATYQRLRSSERLREIFNRAGAWRRAAKATQQNKTKHGYDDMIGVELAGDVSRLLPSEIAVLDDEDLELDTLRRIVENQAMCRQYEGLEPQKMGPVVVVVDESGSMSGSKIANAKALALAMAWIAKHQKRWCALVGFSGGTEGTRMVLKPGKWDQQALLNWLEHFYGGGTTLDVPLVELPTKYWLEMAAPKGKTDVILITDAIVHAPKQMIDNFNLWKTKEQVRCISIVLGSLPGDIEKVSNETHCIPALTTDCSAAVSCLSI